VPGGAYYTKWIVAVDEDVDPTDINQVLWAMASRCNPTDDIDILRNTWSTGLDPTQNPPEIRPYGSKALINACKEHRFIPVFSKRTKLRKSVYDKVSDRWGELGLPGTVPNLLAFEPEKGEETTGALYHDEKAMRSAHDMPTQKSAAKAKPAKKKKK
jgi:4-hydroxy-3-polyprenylbenzoate decarboxylase